MKRVGILVSLLAMLGIGTSRATDAPRVTPSPPSLVAQAEKYESEVRADFKASAGHQASTSNELLAWLDKQSEDTGSLSESSKDDLVQKLGATLGQILIHDFGGRWVMAGTPQGPSHGVELLNNKVAFVFNRAARCIFEGEPLSFTAYYQSAASMVKGTPLPPGVFEKHGG